MSADFNSRQLFLAQQLILDQLRANPGPVLAVDCAPGCPDPAREIHELAVWAAGRPEKDTYTLTCEELTAGCGSKAWEERLRRRVREMVEESATPGYSNEKIQLR